MNNTYSPYVNIITEHEYTLAERFFISESAALGDRREKKREKVGTLGEKRLLAIFEAKQRELEQKKTFYYKNNHTQETSSSRENLPSLIS